MLLGSGACEAACCFCCEHTWAVWGCIAERSWTELFSKLLLVVNFLLSCVRGSIDVWLKPCHLARRCCGSRRLSCICFLPFSPIACFLAS